MGKRVRLKWWGVGISIGFYAAALAFFLIAPSYDALPLRFTAQFVTLIVVSALGTTAIVSGRSTVSRALVLLSKSVIVLVLSFPLTNGNAVALFLAIPIIVELLFNFDRSLALALSGGFVAAFGLSRLMSLGWAVETGAHDALEYVGFPVLILLCVGFLTDLARRYRILLAEQQEHIERLDSAVQQLSEANLGFQRYADFIAERSTADERNRVTREVHDTTIYALTNLKMMLEAAGYMARAESEKLKSLLANAYSQARDGIDNTRNALRALRAINERGIGNFKAVQRIVEAFNAATNVEVKVEFGTLPRKTREQIDRFIYRFIQEGLTNAFRHGRATKILVLFWLQNGVLTITVHDNGRSAPSVTEGIGLRGMRERIGEIGGHLEVQNLQGGFKLVARIPYTPGEETQEEAADENRAGRRPSPVRG